MDVRAGAEPLFVQNRIVVIAMPGEPLVDWISPVPGASYTSGIPTRIPSWHRRWTVGQVGLICQAGGTVIRLFGTVRIRCLEALPCRSIGALRKRQPIASRVENDQGHRVITGHPPVYGTHSFRQDLPNRYPLLPAVRLLDR